MSAIPPRLLTDREAAAYLSMPVATVRKAGWGRVCMGRVVRYDRLAIDAILDRQNGLTTAPPTGANNNAPTDDPEDAFDRFFSKSA